MPPILRSKRDFRLRNGCCEEKRHAGFILHTPVLPFTCSLSGCATFSRSIVSSCSWCNTPCVFGSCCWQLSYLSPKSSCSVGEREKKGGSVEWECQEYIDAVYLISFPFCAHISLHSTLLQLVDEPRTSTWWQFLQLRAIEYLRTGSWPKVDNSRTFVLWRHSAL